MILLCLFAFCIAGLARLDRYFFKHNKSFCVRFIYSTLPYNPDWEIPPLTKQERESFKTIFSQKFHYLGKGNSSFAFASEDGNYVIKVMRFPSTLRPFSWLSHPFSRFKSYRIKNAKNSYKKLHTSFHSFKLAYNELREETGLLYLHLNQSHDLEQTVSLVDRLGYTYEIPLDQLSFLLQKRASLIYPTLDRLKASGDYETARKTIKNILSLISSTAQKGIIDFDPILRKNYGLLEDRAIFIDLGSLSRDESLKEPSRMKAHVCEMTGSLKTRLENLYPEFLPFYNEEIAQYLQK